MHLRVLFSICSPVRIWTKVCLSVTISNMDTGSSQPFTSEISMFCQFPHFVSLKTQLFKGKNQMKNWINTCQLFHFKPVSDLAMFVKACYAPAAILDCPFLLFFAQSLHKAASLQLQLCLFPLVLEHVILLNTFQIQIVCAATTKYNVELSLAPFWSCNISPENHITWTHRC